MTELNSKLYWQLSGFYLFYFASIGTLIPYLGLYLQSHNYSAAQIATVFAVIMGTKIIAPNIWGWIADKSGKRMQIIRLASFISLLAFSGIFISVEYHWLIFVMIVFSFFWNANLPQFEAVTLLHLGKNTGRYSSIRLWGSLGFVLLVALLGSIFEQYDVISFPYIICALLLGIWIFSLITPEAINAVHHVDAPNFSSVIKQPVVILFFILVFLLQASHGPYYAFYSIYLEDNNYSRTIIGQFWALGVIAEILIFMVMHKMLKFWRAETLLFCSLVFTSVRWLLVANYIDSFAIMFIAQLFHAASFGIFHAAAIHLVHKYFPANSQGRGQALYSSLSFGAGGAIGAIYSGMTWDSLGPQWTFSIASLICVIATVIALFYLRLNHSNIKETQN